MCLGDPRSTFIQAPPRPRNLFPNTVPSPPTHSTTLPNDLSPQTHGGLWTVDRGVAPRRGSRRRTCRGLGGPPTPPSRCSRRPRPAATTPRATFWCAIMTPPPASDAAPRTYCEYVGLNCGLPLDRKVEDTQKHLANHHLLYLRFQLSPRRRGYLYVGSVPTLSQRSGWSCVRVRWSRAIFFLWLCVG